MIICASYLRLPSRTTSSSCASTSAIVMLTFWIPTCTPALIWTSCATFAFKLMSAVKSCESQVSLPVGRMGYDPSHTSTSSSIFLTESSGTFRYTSGAGALPADPVEPADGVRVVVVEFVMGAVEMVALALVRAAT